MTLPRNFRNKCLAAKHALWGLTALCFAVQLSTTHAAMQPLNQVPDEVGQRLAQQMIWVSNNAKLDSAFVAFRKQVVLAEVPARAKLHLFADVRYMLWINGKYVQRGPARFDPKGPEYDTTDVASYLKQGDNELAIVVMADQSNGKMMHHAPGLTVSLEVSGPQGGSRTFGTDSNWKWSDQTRYRNPRVDWGNEMDVIDSTIEKGDWTQSTFDDHEWKPAEKIDANQWGALSARRIPLLKETPLEVKLNGRELPLIIGAGQSARFKVGRLALAYTLIDFDAEAGTRFELPYAGISYTAKAGHQIYLTSDTHGVSGGTVKVLAGKITIHSFKLVELLYPFECAGSFTSNDPLLNKLWKLCARSVQVMSDDSYNDCVDRERTEWMDDTPPCYDITQTAMAGPSDHGGKVYGDSRLMGELVRRTALSLQPEGWVKAHTCSDRFDIHAKMEDRACDWVEGARLYFESTGNAAAIREIWPAVVSQMNYFLDRRSPRGLVVAREWVMWDNPMGYENGEGTGLNAYVCKALSDAAFLAKVIGEKDDATRYAKAAGDLAAAINLILWDEREGTYYSGYDTPQEQMPAGVQKGKVGLQPDWHLRAKPPTLADNRIAPTVFSALFALDQQIVPPERFDRVQKYLLSQPDPDTRIMYYYYYWKQAYAANKPELDCSVLKAMRTRWKTMSNEPWQTSWEDFTEGSKAHCYGMFPGYFLSAYVLGVRPGSGAVDKNILIDPRLGDLMTAEGTVLTPQGPTFVSWKRSSKQMDFIIKVPADVTATLHLPSCSGNAKLLLDDHPQNLIKASDPFYSLELKAGEHSGTLTLPVGEDPFTGVHSRG